MDNKLTTNQEMGVVMPAVTPKQALEVWKEYQVLKNEIATPDDVQIIGDKKFYKKSYWRKIATFFNLSVEIIEEKIEPIGDTNLVYHFTQKVTAPNGRYAYGTGSCDRLEKGRMNTIHNTRTTAETRAFNRAVSNLVGGGEVSAEEMTDDDRVIKRTDVKTVIEANGKCTECHATGKYHKPGCSYKE